MQYAAHTHKFPSLPCDLHTCIHYVAYSFDFIGYQMYTSLYVSVIKAFHAHVKLYW